MSATARTLASGAVIPSTAQRLATIAARDLRPGANVWVDYGPGRGQWAEKIVAVMPSGLVRCTVHGLAGTTTRSFEPSQVRPR